LVIPDKPGTGALKSGRQHARNLPPGVERAIRIAPVKSGRWKYIVIHHSAVDTGTVQSMERYHREVRHMENGLDYHFVIGNGSGMRNGEIATGHRWVGQLDGGHLASEALNKVAIGICLVGNFDDHLPSSAQLNSLRSLTLALMERCKLGPEAVKIHRQINTVSTRCPGARFPTEVFLRSLK
jgi:N-acetyl-anhydromuramyl-L-alanine amidase AmpD